MDRINKILNPANLENPEILSSLTLVGLAS